MRVDLREHGSKFLADGSPNPEYPKYHPDTAGSAGGNPAARSFQAQWVKNAGVSEWYKTKPWDTITPTNLPPWASYLNQENVSGQRILANYLDGKMVLRPAFFEADPATRANIMYHEASHAVQGAFTARPDWEQIVAPIKANDAYWNFVESPAYDYQGILSMTDETWRDILDSNPAKAAYYKALIADAAAIGMPTGRIVTTIKAKGDGYKRTYHAPEPIPGLTPGTEVPIAWFSEAHAGHFFGSRAKLDGATAFARTTTWSHFGPADRTTPPLMDGFHGKAIYLTAASTPGKSIPPANTSRLTVHVEPKKTLEVDGPAGFSEWLRAHDPQISGTEATLKREGYDSVLMRNARDEGDTWLMAYDPSIVKSSEPIAEAHGGHYFGAWPPDGQRALGLATPEVAKLIAAMEAKYPGSDWKQLANLDPALAPIAAGEVDEVMGRFGKDASWKFKGIRTPAKGGNTLAEVKHIDGTDGSGVFLPIDHWGSAEHMQHLWEKAKLNTKWSVSNQEPTWQGFAKSIIAHEMGHEFMGLNLHLRLGADRDAPVRKLIEPWLASTFWPNYAKAHISQYGRHNAHEAWAELWSAALGYGHPQDEQGYHTALAQMLGQYYPIPAAMSEARPETTDLPPTIESGGGSGWACGWAQNHPDISALTGIDVENADLTEEHAGHYFGSWHGGKASSGGYGEGPGDPALAKRALAGGFTAKGFGMFTPQSGYMVSPYQEREAKIPAAGLTAQALADRIDKYRRDNAALLHQPGHFVGGWLNPDDNNVYLDVSIRAKAQDEAKRLAKRHKQIAVYDLSAGQEVRFAEGHAGHFFGHWTGRHPGELGAHPIDSKDADPQHTKEHTSAVARMRFITLAKAFPGAALRLADGTTIAAEEALAALANRTLDKARRKAILLAIEAKMTGENMYDHTLALGNLFSGGKAAPAPAGVAPSWLNEAAAAPKGNLALIHADAGPAILLAAAKHILSK